jgi:putative peptidoglycan lipid II flippase
VNQPSGAFRSTLIVSVARVASALLALAMGTLSARYFGTSAEKDCYVVANAVPGLVTSVLLGGIWTTLLVVLAEIGEREGVSAQVLFTRTILRRLVLILVPAALAAALFPEILIRGVAPGFAPEQVLLAARLLRFTAFAPLGMVSYTVIRCLFETRSRFAVPTFLSLLIPLFSLVTLLVFVERIGIFTLAVGPLLGMVSAISLLLFAATRTLRDPPGFTPAPRTSGGDAARHRLFWGAFVPMSIGANSGQINLIVDNAFASYLPTGSIAMLGFAFVIIANAEQLTILSLIETAFPRYLSAALRGTDDLAEMLWRTLRYMVLLAAPISAGALAFGVPLARLLFERGRFGADATRGVASLLACYSLEILFMGYLLSLSRVLLARKRFAPVAWIALLGISGNAFLDWLLMKTLGLEGIALATTAVTLLQCLILLPYVRREVPSIHGPRGGLHATKVLLSAALMGTVVYAWSAIFGRLALTGPGPTRLLEVAVGLALGAATYVGLLWLLGVEEARAAIGRVMRTLSTR